MLENIAHIIRGCIESDPRYQRLLYDRYRGFALKIVFRYVYRYEHAIEVTNDGFVKLLVNISKFSCEEEKDAEKLLMGWIRKIMINASIDALRKQHMVPEIGGIPDSIWNTSDQAQNADQLMLYRDLIILVKKLPPALRIVFNMYVIDGYAHSEIADMLNIPVGTSKSNLSRARALLQKFIHETERLTECKM